MKTAVVYTSQTGFTKKYAGWIAERTGADLLEINEAKKTDMSQYDAIVYGGWACAGNISKISWFKGNVDKWEGKKLAAFCVGGSPIENPDIEVMMKRVLPEEMLKKVKVFYCPGGFNYEKMSTSSRVMMKMFVKALKAKKDKTEDDETMIKMISQSYDISDVKYTDPIVAFLEEK